MHDKKLFNQILQSTRNTEDALYRIARYIEECNDFEDTYNYWDKECLTLNDNERIFYTTWGWLSYLELEACRLIKPNPDFKRIFGKNRENLIISLIDQDSQDAETELQKLRLENEAGKLLFNWASKNLK